MAQSRGFRRSRQIGRPLADLLVPVLGKTLAARGFAAADVVLAWPDIVGERLSRVCEPILLEWPRGVKPSEASTLDHKAATLVVRVQGAFGLEIQHLAPVILERVNAYFGWRCADKLAIRPGRMAKKAEERSRPFAPDAKSLARGREFAIGIDDGKLREALAGLGAAVLAKR